jgi:hypothetical protein
VRIEELVEAPEFAVTAKREVSGLISLSFLPDA